ncbi:oxidoreductase, putative [Paecilomyces variotii No. 5]|uniref:Oxidoreductase, putative n=1 Tax=Byssochlamys spectabilis (strain No. 5 / NBRC 109023) TaxID=1356009 RepID=V5FHJ0_BYSSN|nr:oxidoreductase, putative [Paecilomyces variotii No. 5]
MAPIRVGLVGLSSTATNPQAPGAWALLAHLPWLLSSPDYKLVALANSSVESAKKAIVAHKLSSDVKAYGSPEELANDPSIDLVVISVNVGKHYELAKPALLAKKDVFVEWPLGASAAEAAELTDLAKANGSRTVVGLQARSDPLILKVKEIIKAGQIGEVTSSTALGSFSPLPVDAWIEGAEYYLDIKSGGNAFTIFFGHFLDSFTQVVGDFKDVQSILQTRYPTIPIFNGEGKVVNPSHPKSAPDHIFVQGTLENGAGASISFRSVPAAVDGVGFRWLISGTKGEIEITMPESHWQMGNPGATLKLRVGKDSAAQDVDFSTLQDPSISKIPFPGPNTASLYEAFAKGDRESYATFESSLKLHKLLDRIVQASAK